MRDAVVLALGEQCAAIHTHSSKQASASSERDSDGVDVRPAFFLPLSAPPPTPTPPPPPPPPLLPFPLLPLALLALAAAAAALASPELFPSVSYCCCTRYTGDNKPIAIGGVWVKRVGGVITRGKRSEGK